MSHENVEPWREQKKLVEFSPKVLSREGSCSEAMSELWTKHLTWKNWYSAFSSVLPTLDPTRLGSFTVSFWCQWGKMFGWISLAHQLRSWLWLKNLSGGFWQDTGEIVDHAIKSDLHKYRYFLWCIVHLCIIT